MHDNSNTNIEQTSYKIRGTVLQKLEIFNNHNSRYLPKLDVSTIWVEKNMYIPNQKGSTLVNEHMHIIQRKNKK